MREGLTGFESAFGRKPPQQLIKLFDETVVRSAPLRFVFIKRSWVIEIQYFLTVEDAKPIDIENDRFAFAANTDGSELLLDLVSDGLPVLQREHGDIDTLGLDLSELLDPTTMRFSLS